MINYQDFQKIDMRVGTITRAKNFPEARRPAYQLWIDFGQELGIKKTSAQITEHYTTDSLIGKQVIAVVNFPPKQIGKFMSEVLVLGAVQNDKTVILLEPEQEVTNGMKIS